LILEFIKIGIGILNKIMKILVKKLEKQNFKLKPLEWKGHNINQKTSKLMN